jgi:hypothetical protein
MLGASERLRKGRVVELLVEEARRNGSGDAHTNTFTRALREVWCCCSSSSSASRTLRRLIRTK